MSEKNTPELNAPTPAPTPAPEAGRRRILGAGLAAPVLMSVASSPVMANGLHICSPSGWASAGAITNAKHSSVIRHKIADCGARSPGYWKNADDSKGGGNKGAASVGADAPPPWPMHFRSNDGLTKLPSKVWDYAAKAYVPGYKLKTKDSYGTEHTSLAISYEDLFPGMGNTSGTSGQSDSDYSFFPHWWLNNRGANISRTIWYLTAARLNILSGIATEAYVNEAEILQMWLQLVVQKKGKYSYGGVNLTETQVQDYLHSAES